jgi:hypothetical protein
MTKTNGIAGTRKTHRKTEASDDRFLQNKKKSWDD